MEKNRLKTLELTLAITIIICYYIKCYVLRSYIMPGTLLNLLDGKRVAFVELHLFASDVFIRRCSIKCKVPITDITFLPAKFTVLSFYHTLIYSTSQFLNHIQVYHSSFGFKVISKINL